MIKRNKIIVIIIMIMMLGTSLFIFNTNTNSNNFNKNIDNNYTSSNSLLNANSDFTPQLNESYVLYLRTNSYFYIYNIVNTSYENTTIHSFSDFELLTFGFNGTGFTVAITNGTNGSGGEYPLIMYSCVYIYHYNSNLVLINHYNYKFSDIIYTAGDTGTSDKPITPAVLKIINNNVYAYYYGGRSTNGGYFYPAVLGLVYYNNNNSFYVFSTYGTGQTTSSYDYTDTYTMTTSYIAFFGFQSAGFEFAINLTTDYEYSLTCSFSDKFHFYPYANNYNNNSAFIISDFNLTNTDSTLIFQNNLYNNLHFTNYSDIHNMCYKNFNFTLNNNHIFINSFSIYDNYLYYINNGSYNEISLLNLPKYNLELENKNYTKPITININNITFTYSNYYNYTVTGNQTITLKVDNPIGYYSLYNSSFYVDSNTTQTIVFKLKEFNLTLKNINYTGNTNVSLNNINYSYNNSFVKEYIYNTTVNILVKNVSGYHIFYKNSVTIKSNYTLNITFDKDYILKIVNINYTNNVTISINKVNYTYKNILNYSDYNSENISIKVYNIYGYEIKYIKNLTINNNYTLNISFIKKSYILTLINYGYSDYVYAVINNITYRYINKLNYSAVYGSTINISILNITGYYITYNNKIILNSNTTEYIYFSSASLVLINNNYNGTTYVNINGNEYGYVSEFLYHIYINETVNINILNINNSLIKYTKEYNYHIGDVFIDYINYSSYGYLVINNNFRNNTNYEISINGYIYNNVYNDNISLKDGTYYIKINNISNYKLINYYYKVNIQTGRVDLITVHYNLEYFNITFYNYNNAYVVIQINDTQYMLKSFGNITIKLPAGFHNITFVVSNNYNVISNNFINVENGSTYNIVLQYSSSNWFSQNSGYLIILIILFMLFAVVFLAKRKRDD